MQGSPEAFYLILTAVLPILAFLVAINVVVRLAIRHEHRNHHDR